MDSQGDLVSGLIRRISRFIMWVIGVINLLTKSPLTSTLNLKSLSIKRYCRTGSEAENGKAASQLVTYFPPLARNQWT